jgi:aldehyde dehydrogenase (NAD+)
VSIEASAQWPAAVDRTAKLFVGGKQMRPDSGYSLPVHAPDGRVIGEVGAGNRKDIRNAVAAARAAAGWSATSAHNRAQVLYYVAENLAVRAEEFARQLMLRTGATEAAARAEVDAALARLFTYAAWADKFDGAVHAPPLRGVALAMHEPLGVIGIACPDDAPLLALVSLVAPALAMGNRVVVVPGAMPLVATDLYQVIETSDVPAGVLNIVTGERSALLPALAKHDDVDSVWCFGSAEEAALVERESIGNLKRTFVNHGRRFDWLDRATEGRPWLHEAVQTKNIWIPYGD